jgi:hypothetical protein
MLVVRVALQRPSRSSCSHCAIFGVLAALNTPTEIFPILTIPVLSMLWTDNGHAKSFHAR